MKSYDHKKIEARQQKRWEKERIFEVREDEGRKKFYGLVEFPYPSGDGLHVGHPRSYTAMDIICRKRRMEGFNVLFPIGFDSFGLPAENYAIKTGKPPAETTKKNISVFTRQLKSFGLSFDWSRAFSTSDPEYYKWTQWLFLKFFEKGLAYKKAMPINWCPACKIGLANEEAAGGVCERCGGPVEKREKEQWVIAITKYADQLLAGLKNVDYASRIKTAQENWIGRSEGAMIRFAVILNEGREAAAVKNLSKNVNRSFARAQDDNTSTIPVFTTRPDTIFGATYLVIAPEHELVEKLREQIKNKKEVEKYIAAARRKSDLERTELQKEKTGVELKGVKAINPANGEEIPIFIADYVLATYGTGAIMAVPAHDERDFDFAKKYGVEIRPVVQPVILSTFVSLSVNSAKDLPADDKDSSPPKADQNDKKCFPGDGVNVNSDFLNGLKTADATKKIIAWLEENNLGEQQVQYHLRDWIFSRQRYWGEPIPLIFCHACKKLMETPNTKHQTPNFSAGEQLNPGWFSLSEKDLPLELPKIKKYQPTDTGESPLSTLEKWVKTKCPKCGGPARRETDTMPNWAGSNWYFLRYCDPKNKNAFASPEKLKYWLPVDWYNGGMEHAVLHLLYSRFWNIVMNEIGLSPVAEPYAKRTAQGLILDQKGDKMSKSRGNVVNPDEMAEKYGADALRMYIMFIGPFDQPARWDTNGLVGVRRFLERVWTMKEKIDFSPPARPASPELQRGEGGDKGGREDGEFARAIFPILHRTIKKVGEDIEAMRFNTAVAKMMELANEMGREGKIPAVAYLTFLKILYPFAPHISEELWEMCGQKTELAFEPWPVFDSALAAERAVTIAVQINGKLRDSIEFQANEVSEEEAKTAALESAAVQKWLDGKEPKKVIYVKNRLISFVV